MKYNNEVIINADKAKVVELFDSFENMEKWQPGFISSEHISGERGQVGAITKLKYKMGKREVDMTETIISRKLPDSMSFTFEAKNVWNASHNHFEELPDNKTKYWTENEFKMGGFMKIIAFFMPGAFKKETQKNLNLFKDFVHKETSGK